MDVPVDTPGKGRLGAEPLVLGHHAEGHPGRRQAPDRGGQAVFAADLIPGPPDVVEQHIKDGHGHRGDPLAQAQGHGVILQAGGAEGQGPGHQMEGVPRPQQDGHGAEEGELGIALAAPEHPDAQGDDGGQIDRIKKCFHNGLHKLLLFFKKQIQRVISGRFGWKKAESERSSVYRLKNPRPPGEAFFQ